MSLGRALGLVLAVVGAGCLGRSLPVPPPVVSAIRSVPCDRAQCPGGGVVVTLEGGAQAGALVIVEDLNRDLPDGQFLGAVARATPSSTYRVIVLPQTVPGVASVFAAQPGDALSVYQVADGELSNAVMVTVPRP